MKERQSNIELLRIISMAMVLCLHIDGASLGLPELKGEISTLSSRDMWRLAVEALSIVVVNCFTLISGYFGIRLRLKTVFIYLFQCVFYSVIIYTVVSLFISHTFTWKDWGTSWLVLTHTDLWYVPAYFLLMILSPFLNEGFDRLNPKTTLWITIAFTVFTIWAGWYWGGSFNARGYTVFQLLMMYCIGRCLAIHQGIFFRIGHRKLKMVCLCVFLLSAFVTGIYACWDLSKAFAYNSPVVILESVALMILFMEIRCRSRAINYIAKSAFAVYLIHKAPIVWGNYLKPFIRELWSSSSIFEFTLYSILMIICIYFIAMVADACRRWITRLFLK